MLASIQGIIGTIRRNSDASIEITTDDQREPNGRKARNTGRPPGRPPRIWTADECKRVTDCYYAGATMRSISKAMGILSEAVIAASTCPTHNPAQDDNAGQLTMYRKSQAGHGRQYRTLRLAALRECNSWGATQ